MNENPFDDLTDEYEHWFKENEILFQSELLALKQVIPVGKNGVEIGIGSGIFAEKLEIKHGIDPSGKMLDHAKQRKLIVEQGFAENLPYSGNSFDFVVFITSMCFIHDPEKALAEAYRVVKDKGDLIIAFIDSESSLGKSLQKSKEEDPFFRYATFYSVKEITRLIEVSHFEISEIIQTLISMDTKTPENPIPGYGQGGFIVIKAQKKQ